MDEFLAKFDEVEFISGGSSGADQLAFEYAKENFLQGYIFYGGSEFLPIFKDGYTFWCIPFGVLFGQR